jgi:hypothetical protein
MGYWTRRLNSNWYWPVAQPADALKAIDAIEVTRTRGRREDEAPRLSNKVPGVTSLKLAVEERCTRAVATDRRRPRHGPVRRATTVGGPDRRMNQGHTAEPP